MQEAPTTFEEFLQFQKLTAWPITLEEDIQITGELAVYRSPNAIADYLCKNAPFPMEVIDSRKAAFLKIWKTFFLSEASVAVFKDGFWWYFLHKFKPNQKDQDLLFNQIADSFVYADCLAQAIFSAFYEAFSMSHNHFGDDFKTELTDLICLWVSGIKPLPFIWKKWNLKWLYQLVARAREVEKVPTTRSISSGSMDFNFEELIKDTKYIQILDTTSTITTGRKTDDLSKKSRESHYIGPVPEFQQVLFNPGGRSPLVAHYLQMQGIAHPAAFARPYIKRTEISKILTPCTQTYQDAIGKNRKFHKKRLQDYVKLREQTQEEILEIQKERIRNNLTFNRTERAIIMNPDEVKIQSELLVEKWEHATLSSSRHQRKDERETEAEETKKADSDSEVTPGPVEV